MKDRRVLVTGASGLLGGWLCRTLVERGIEVIGTDRVKRRGAVVNDLVDSIDFIQGDLEDYDFVVRILNESQAQFILHMAAQAIVGVANRNPLSTFRSNIEATWNILEAVRLLRRDTLVSGLIVASSDKAYGDQEDLPYTEESPMQGRFPYDVSKSCADLITRSYYHSFGIPVCITRCANLFGGGDLNWSRIVPGTIRSLLRGERPIIRSDGTPIRDYLYVKDAAEAILILCKRMIEDRSLHGEAFNLSIEEPLSVAEMVSRIARLLRREELEPIIENSACLEIQKQYLSSRKFRDLTGWEPVYRLNRGLEETIKWYRDFLPGYDQAEPRDTSTSTRGAN